MRSRLHFILTAGLFISCLHGKAQSVSPVQARLDSMLLLLKGGHEADTERIAVLAELGYEYTGVMLSESQRYGALALAAATKARWPAGQAMAYNALGHYHLFIQEYGAAMDTLLKALELSEQLHDTAQALNASRDLAFVCQGTGKLPEMWRYIQKMRQLAAGPAHEEDKMQALQLTAAYYTDCLNEDSAFMYDQQALVLARKHGHRGYIAAISADLAGIDLHHRRYASASAGYLESLRLNKEAGNKANELLDYQTLCELYYKAAMDTLAALPDDELLIPAGKTARLRTAAQYALAGLAMAKAQADLIYYPIFLRELANIYAAQYRYKDAYAELKAAVLFQDTVRSEHETAHAQSSDDKYLSEAEAKELARLERLNKRYEKLLIAAGILVFIGAGIAIFRLYRRRQARSLQQVRQKISKDLHDDIGAAVTSIGILANISKSDAVDSTKRKEFLETIAWQSRHVSEALADIVWSVNPEADELDQTFVRFQRYAAEIFEAKGIHYDFVLPPEGMNHLKLDMQRRQHLLLIFKEAVNNLAKYSEATEATVSVQLQPQRLLMMITDNGIGFDTGAARKGNGLGNMQKRAESLGGDLTIQSSMGSGTIVKLLLPLGK